jgi:hypothetical protein
MRTKNRISAIAAATRRLEKKREDKLEMDELLAKLDARKASIAANAKEETYATPANTHGTGEHAEMKLNGKTSEGYARTDKAYIDGSVMMEAYNATKQSEWD